MPRQLKQYWIILVETFLCQKHGPYFSEKEVDDEAKVLIRKIMKDSPKRAQNIRFLLMEMDNNNFDVSLYAPEFLLDIMG